MCIICMFLSDDNAFSFISKINVPTGSMTMWRSPNWTIINIVLAMSIKTVSNLYIAWRYYHSYGPLWRKNQSWKTIDDEHLLSILSIYFTYPLLRNINEKKFHPKCNCHLNLKRHIMTLPMLTLKRNTNSNISGLNSCLRQTNWKLEF